MVVVAVRLRCETRARVHLRNKKSAIKSIKIKIRIHKGPAVIYQIKANLLLLLH